MADEDAPAQGEPRPSLEGRHKGPGVSVHPSAFAEAYVHVYAKCVYLHAYRSVYTRVYTKVYTNRQF